MSQAVNLDREHLIKYLQIASGVRKRQAKLFLEQWGPTSASVREITQEVGRLDLAITQLQVEPTEIEKAIQAKK